jgi:ribosomal protein L1
MKTTIDLPDGLLHRAKIAAAQRRTTLKELVMAGLEHVIETDTEMPSREAALARLKKGLHLGGVPLTRAKAHERK